MYKIEKKVQLTSWTLSLIPSPSISTSMYSFCPGKQHLEQFPQFFQQVQQQVHGFWQTQMKITANKTPMIIMTVVKLPNSMGFNWKQNPKKQLEFCWFFIWSFNSSKVWVMFSNFCWNYWINLYLTKGMCIDQKLKCHSEVANCTVSSRRSRCCWW